MKIPVFIIFQYNSNYSFYSLKVKEQMLLSTQITYSPKVNLLKDNLINGLQEKELMLSNALTI